MGKPVVNLEPALEDPCSDERTISFHNGAPGWHDYQGGLGRFRNRPDGGLDIDLHSLGDKVFVDVPERNLKPRPPSETYLVNAIGGAFLISNGQVIDFIDYTLLHPGLVRVLTRICKANGVTLLWGKAIDGLAEHLKRLSVKNGLSEEEVLRQFVTRGRLGQQRSHALQELEKKMFRSDATFLIIGRNITKMREARGLSVEELAERASLDAFEVLAFEGGLEMTFPDELVRIAAALGLEDPARLLDENLTIPGADDR